MNVSRVHQLGHLRKPELIAIYLSYTGAIANGQAGRHGYGPNDMTRDQLIAAIIHHETQLAKDTQ